MTAAWGLINIDNILMKIFTFVSKLDGVAMLVTCLPKFEFETVPVVAASV